MKKQNTRAMTGEEKNVKAKPETEPEQPSSVSKKIRCIRECEMPGVGHFKHGDVIEDAGKIARIADNPNFEIIVEEEKP